MFLGYLFKDSNLCPDPGKDLHRIVPTDTYCINFDNIENIFEKCPV